jgi:adenine-specific DNA-methyltransferase
MGSPLALPDAATAALDGITTAGRAAVQRTISERNGRFFEAEADKLDGWADDLKVGLEREIKDLDRQIKEARRLAKAAPTLEEKLAGQKQIKALESKRSQMRKELFDAQDAIDAKREELIAKLEKQLQQRTVLTPLFQINWKSR